jgi:hypothetical protein
MLVLERKDQGDQTPILGGQVLLTPPIGCDYWAYRVIVGEGQAVVGFPKFGTIGIGFAVEEDWNTNLPYTCKTEAIFGHIAHNKGDDSISDDNVRAAIALIQAAATEDRSKGAS